MAQTMPNQCHCFKDTAVHQSQSPEALTSRVTGGCGWGRGEGLPWVRVQTIFPLWLFSQEDGLCGAWDGAHSPESVSAPQTAAEALGNGRAWRANACPTWSTGVKQTEMPRHPTYPSEAGDQPKLSNPTWPLGPGHQGHEEHLPPSKTSHGSSWRDSRDGGAIRFSVRAGRRVGCT